MSSDEFPFEIGTIVKLKSGGPDMTVEDFDLYMCETKKKVKCVFFSGETRIEENFAPGTLKEVSRPSK